MKNINIKFILGLGVFLLLMINWSCIKEDDGIPTDLNLPKLSIEDINYNEGDVDDTIQVNISLVGENKTNVVLSYAGISTTATSTFDFEVLGNGRLTFAPGETSKSISVRIVGDEVIENKESFQIKIFNPISATLTKDVSTITINDDDNNTAGIVIPTAGYTTPEAYTGYNLVWQDEFDSTALRTNFWNYEMGNNNGWGNNELQYYREDNTSIKDGHLVITAKKQNFGGNDFTSSRLTTQGKKFFKFGRIDIRAALPKGKGLWPALWMLGTNINTVSWPACGEIDIMELAGDIPNRTVGTVHYGANTASHQFKSVPYYLEGDDNFQDEFHVFSINWESDLIQFYVDDVLYKTITPASLNGAAYPFNKNMFFIFNVAVGGTFPGNPNESTPFPQSMIVDYIRVFQKN